MARSKTVSPNDVLSPATRAKVEVNRQSLAHDDRSYQERQHEEAAYLHSVFNKFVALDHGYLKMRRDGLTDVVHLAFTWTTGKHHGSYVYVATTLYDVVQGLDTLLRKIFEVDEGSRQPTPDRRNSHYRPTVKSS